MPTFDLAWWMWFLLGILLLAGEILTPGGFFIFFFGLGALAVGLLKLFGLHSLPLEGLLFVIISVGLLVLFRQRLLDKFKGTAVDQPLDNLAQEIAIAVEEIAAGSVGRVELRGTMWSAQNVGDLPIPPKQRCRVVRAEGLLLHVCAL